ncbi:helix-turn-helix domain-containing protein [Pseudoalteromonas sp. B131b]|uniref:helix-turn-helix transcriptional regulator n=1 Tax=Pseudoalteromonas sp. B131b TaxID=630493 RepID=UPI00301D68B0
MSRSTVGMERIAHMLEPPKGSGHYIKKFIDKRGLSASKTAQQLNVSPSTVTRLLAGGALTPAMAAKLHNVFNIDEQILFNLEAQANVQKTRELLHAV